MNATNEPTSRKSFTKRLAEILVHHAPKGSEEVHGVTFDGKQLWFVDFGSGRVVNMDPETGIISREIPGLTGDAGTATDGEHLWQVTGGEIVKVLIATGEVLGRVPAPDGQQCSGLAYAAGALWIGHYRSGNVLKLDADTGEVLKTLESDRLVTGVTWTPDGELWHASESEDFTEYELRRLDPETGQVLDCIELPEGVPCSGLAADDDRFWCGDARKGGIRAVRRSAG